MSDHVDGPRSIGDPSADVTDLFAFTGPENPARAVRAMLRRRSKWPSARR
jgi:hypothetical protein